jgi:hypothetical protein
MAPGNIGLAKPHTPLGEGSRRINFVKDVLVSFGGKKNGRFLEWKGALLGFSGMPAEYLFPLPGLSQQRKTLLGTAGNPMPECPRY